jgi:hypothetical protein
MVIIPAKRENVLMEEIKKTPAPIPPKPKEREPLWPMDEEQKIQWRKEMKLMEEKAKNPPPPDILTPERKAEIHAMAAASAAAAFERLPRRKSSKEDEPRERKTKVKTESTRQTRLGQTKLIDSLLKEGKNDKQIFDAVREKIPAYPADKLPKLIKLRQYHMKKK